MNANELSVTEQIGQMIMVGMEGSTINKNIKTMIQNYKIGGVILYKKNFKNYNEMIKLVNDLKKLNCVNKIPLFIAIDQEGGRVNRMPQEIKNLITAKKLASTQNIKLVHEAGKVIGKLLKDSGFSVNFAPVLDIQRFEDNHAIGDRCYGKDAHTVSRYGIEFMNGLKDQGMISVIKHFPGHGATTKDSHYFLPIIHKKISELEQEDLIPFKNAIKSQAEAIMLGHLLINDVNKIYPCSLSREFIIKFLRRKYKYNGLIITDDLNMRAIRFVYGVKLATVKALEAGNDILLFRFKNNEGKVVIQKIQKLVENGKIKAKRIEQSVNRIIKLKEKYHLDDNEIVKGCDINKINQCIENINQQYNERS